MTWSASSEILLVIVCLVSIVFGRCNFDTAPFLNEIYAELTTTSVTHGWPHGWHVRHGATTASRGSDSMAVSCSDSGSRR